MISLVVIDSSAASRNTLVERISGLVRADIASSGLVPRIDIRSLSTQEVQFHAAPDICLVGEELSQKSPSELVRLKQIIPYTPILVYVPGPIKDLFLVEQLARLGADDVITAETTPSEFMRKVVFLSRRNMKAGSGKLVLVDGGKGGVGVTSITAALSELLVFRGKSVVAVDCDFETQDLSRFLQVRPFVNDNLTLLLDEQRPITEESVRECLAAVWGPEHAFSCLVPVPETDDLYNMQGQQLRHWLSVLEVLDGGFNCLVVDIGCARGLLRRALYQVADRLVFVINGDPASFYASIDRLAQARAQLSAGIELAVIENTAGTGGLSNESLRREFMRAARIEDKSWAPLPVPYCRTGSRWPGSGATLYSQSRKGVAAGLDVLAETLGLIEKTPAQNKLIGLAQEFGAKARSLFGERRAAISHAGAQVALPQSPAALASARLHEDGQPLRLLEGRNGISEAEQNLADIAPEKLVSGAKAA